MRSSPPRSHETVRHFEDLEDLTDPKDFFDRARFGASVELQDQDGNDIVRACLPERNAENAKVTVENGVLKSSRLKLALGTSA